MTVWPAPTSSTSQVTQGTHCTGKMEKTFTVRENREFGNFAKNTGDLVCSSCKFPDILIFAVKISQYFFKLDKSVKSVLCQAGKTGNFFLFFYYLLLNSVLHSSSNDH